MVYSLGLIELRPELRFVLFVVSKKEMESSSKANEEFGEKDPTENNSFLLSPTSSPSHDIFLDSLLVTKGFLGRGALFVLDTAVAKISSDNWIALGTSCLELARERRSNDLTVTVSSSARMSLSSL